MRPVLLAAVAITLLLFAPAAVGATATVRYVDDDGLAGLGRGCAGGSYAYRQIQRAVDASARGDTILVCPGAYSPFAVRGRNHDGLSIRSTVPWQARIVLQPTLRTYPDGGLRTLFAVNVVDAADVTIQDFHIKTARTELRRCSLGVLVRYRAASGRILGNRLTSPSIRDLRCVPAFNAIRASATTDSELDETVEIRGNVIKVFGEREIVLSGDGDTSNGRELRAIVAGNIVDRPMYAIEGLGGGMDAFDARIQFLDNATLNIGLGAQFSTVEIRRNRLDQAVVGLVLSCTNGTIAGNRIDGASFGANGINVSGRSGTSLIEDNWVSGFIGGMGDGSPDGKGIWMTFSTCPRPAGSSPPRFVIRDNDFRGNGDPDCTDQTTGDGTAGTANLWRRNLGEESVPGGICGPG